LAFELYHLDLVVESERQIAGHGLGETASQLRWFRLIEAEALLQERGEVFDPDGPFSLETVPAETFHGEARLFELICRAVADLCSNLSCDVPVPVRVAVLCRESEAPWATNPNGYWVHKDPYDKICLPFVLLEDEAEFRRALLHEYAHVITAYLSDDQAPTWLHEAVSMWAETMGESEDVDGECPESWLDPISLDRLLEGEATEETDTVFQGYLQCQWIGRKLQELGGGTMLRHLLLDLGDPGVGKNISRLVNPSRRMDGSLRAVYGIGCRELFGQARQLMLGSSTGGRTLSRG
jgi:hypothetical protein